MNYDAIVAKDWIGKLIFAHSNVYANIHIQAKVGPILGALNFISSFDALQFDIESDSKACIDALKKCQFNAPKFS